jgi:prepilin-type N-terminal cleavage/methylation domain-containing protein
MLPRFSRFRRGFTLIEMSIAAACVVIAGGTAFVLLQSATTLFLSGHAANRSNQLAYLTMDRLTHDVHSSIEVPTLVDANGAGVTLVSGPPVNAAGIRFRVYSGGPFRIPTATAASSTTVGLTLQSGQVMPRAGQLLAIPSAIVDGFSQTVFARIASVSPAPPATSTTPTLTLTGTLGSFATPVVSSGTMVQADSIAHVVNDVAYIVVTPAGPGTPELRFYPRAMSVAADGTTAFNTPANFVVVTANMAASPQPFSMALGDRGVSVNLSVQDTEYSNRVKSTFMKNFAIGSPTLPVRIYNRSLGL